MPVFLVEPGPIGTRVCRNELVHGGWLFSKIRAAPAQRVRDVRSRCVFDLGIDSNRAVFDAVEQVDQLPCSPQMLFRSSAV